MNKREIAWITRMAELEDGQCMSVGGLTTRVKRMKETKLEVRVDWKHINHSEIKSTTDCPIAHALKEQHPREGLWMVWLDKVALWPGGGRLYSLPPKAQEFIRDMLDDKPVLPFTFTLEI